VPPAGRPTNAQRRSSCPGLLYTLSLLTSALDSVGDVFLVAAGLLAMNNGVLPRWLAQIALVSGAFLFLQGFGLGGEINTAGLVLDPIGFALFLVFVLISSTIGLRTSPSTSPPGV
jgi:hypothetical protein